MANRDFLLMVGGRKKRKKPTVFSKNNTFGFEGNDFTLSSVVTYTSDSVMEEPVTVASVYNSPDSQTVQFNEPIQFTDFESLYFEVEVD